MHRYSTTIPLTIRELRILPPHLRVLLPRFLPALAGRLLSLLDYRPTYILHIYLD